MPQSKNIVFAGTPDFAAAHLQALIDGGYTPLQVLTQPDRAAGRGRQLTAPPVKITAEKYDIPIFQPDQLDDEARSYLDNLPRPDLLIVVAYGLLLPQWALNWAMYGAVNVHASLLPRWRGAAPIQRAIEAGDKATGISIMQMDVGLDTGDVWHETQVPIRDTTTAGALYDSLQIAGTRALLHTLPVIFAGEKRPIPQSSDGVTYAKKLTKYAAKINWQEDAHTICRKIRAFNPVPVAHSETQTGTRMRFYEAVPAEMTHNSTCGTVISEEKSGILIACQGGAICVTELQEMGKKRLLAKDFINGKSLMHEVFV